MLCRNCLLLIFLINSVFAQSPDTGKRILFTIDENPVFVDEFVYVYKKNNANNQDAFTKEDINEYLDLFINFKLKVQEARNLGYDTTTAYREELDKYQDQLTKPYLTENEVTEQLLEEAYERMKYEVDVSHILVAVRPGAAPEDTLKAYKKIRKIWEMAAAGQDFNKLALEYSEEPMIEQTNGHLGYFTALQMVYPFENAAYTTPVGEISKPFRTQFGYHVLKVHDKRASRGKVLVSHIMLRFKDSMTEKDSTEVRDRIFDIYDQLVAGYDWETLCKKHSEDLNSRDRGGSLSPFGVGEMIPSFVEASFALDEPGDISDPVKTPYGWHIIKLNGINPLPSFEDYKAQLTRRIRRDSRSDKSEEVLITRLKRENDFNEFTKSKEKVFSRLDSTTFTGSWDPVSFSDRSDTLFSIKDSAYSINDFVDFVNTNFRKSGSGHESIRINRIYEEFYKEKLIEYEKTHLEEKYDDYRYLMKEYREGILLFEIMEKEVWAKSGTDSVGLENFYNNNLDKYRVKERASIVTFEVSNDNGKSKALYDTLTYFVQDSTTDLEKVKKLVKNEFPGAMIKRSGTINSEDPGWEDWMSAGNGVYSGDVSGTTEITLIKDYRPDSIAGLNEIKGIVISDYQDFLDKRWIEELRNKYKVKVEKKELKNLYNTLVQ